MASPVFAQQYGPWALIAGGSEGVGEAFARQLAAEGMHLVLVARRSEPLAQLAQQLRDEWAVEVRTASIDLTAPDVVAQLRAVTDDIEIGLLVCNAGSATRFDDFLDTPLADAQRLFRLNAELPLQLCHHFGDAMRGRGRGGIVLVGSMAGYAGGAGTAVYTGAKAFSRIFAEALWQELKPHGVHVLGMILGATNTPAMARIGMVMDNPQFQADDPAEVVRLGLAQLANGPLFIRGGEQAAHYISTLPRDQAVAMMTAGNQMLFPSGK